MLPLNLTQFTRKLLRGPRATKQTLATTTTIRPAQNVNQTGFEVAVPTLGNLGKLPRELRNQVYKHLVVRRYLVAWPKAWNSRSTAAFMEAKNLSILRVSRAISIEAQSLLYAQSQFSVYLEYSCVLDDDPFEQSCEAADYNRMMHVHFDVDMCRVPDVSWDDDLAMTRIRKTCEASILRFCGGTVERNTLLFTFSNYTPSTSNASPTQILSTPLGEAFKGLFGFKTVLVMVISCRKILYLGRYMENLQALGKSAANLEAWNHRVLTECHLLLDTLRTEIGPFLGPCKSGDNTSEPDRFYSRYLEFHPRDH
ncbi:MAG: hypothetical protein Q9217_000212 [Psora testacea]